MVDSRDPKDWIKIAGDDIAWTESNLRGKIWYGACFSSQQAAEKALKSYILSKGLKAPKIHDLGALLEKCEESNSSFENLKDECATLTVYYAPVRYPEIADFSEMNEEKAKEAYEFAKRIVNFVEEKLKKG